MSLLKILIENKKEDAIIAFIKDGNISTADIDILYSILFGKFDNQLKNINQIKFRIWDLLRKNREFLDFEKLQKYTSIPSHVLKQIFKESYKQVKFPIVFNENKDLANAYIIILENYNDVITFNNNVKKEDLNKIKKATSKNFFVIFDKDFTDNSYMLSVVSGILFDKDKLKNLAFTGKVNEEGEIISVNNIDKKKEICEENNLKLIHPNIVDNIDLLNYLLGKDYLDIPFLILIGKTSEESIKSLRKIEEKIKERNPYFSLENLANFYGIEEKDLMISREERIPPVEDLNNNPWKEIVEEFENKLKNILAKVEDKKIVLHIVNTISSLAYVLGVKLGAKKPVVLYHFKNDNYYPVIDLIDDVRKTKGPLKENYSKIDIDYKYKTNSEEKALGIWLASHNLTGDIPQEKGWDIYIIKSKDNQGNIPIEDEWSLYVSEIYSFINKLKSNKFRKLHLFLSTPVAIAFALGMTVGHFIPTVVYNYGKNSEYYPIYEVDPEKDRSIF